MSDPGSPSGARIRLPKAVLFDNDGVLIESESLHSKAWGILLGELNIAYDPALIQSLIGTTAPEILARVLDRYRPGWTREQYDLDALALRKNDHYLDLTRKGLQLYPGVKEGLEWLRGIDVKAGVVSNAKRRELIAAHDKLGTRELFDVLISRDDAGVAKPDPTPYLMGAATLGLDVEDCLAVEDSPPGLESALMAGMPTVALATTFPEEAIREPVPGRPDLRPVLICRDPRELFQTLGYSA